MHRLQSKRRSIHTGIKILIKHNAVPAYLLQQLNPSQVWKYKNESTDKYYGCELFDYAKKSEQLLHQYSNFYLDRKVINCFIRLSIIIRNAFSNVKGFNKILFTNRSKIVDVIERLHKKISSHTISKFIGVSYQTISGWVIEERNKCAESIINVCRKYKPSQLTSKEVNIIKSLLLDPQFKYWPVRSLYYHALHNNLLHMCLSTFYKYTRRLSVKRSRPLFKKKYGVSIRADAPNQYWHADVMKFKTPDNIMQYIYIVTDNFSKRILSICAYSKLSAAIRRETFQNSVLQMNSKNNSDIHLIVDGGSENVNHTIDTFIDNQKFNLKRFIALKQVPFSNSVAEAVNKIIRNDYLNHFTIDNLHQLQQKLLFITDDYNNKRPHGSLLGLTPTQAYQGLTINSNLISQRIKSMKTERKNINHQEICCRCKMS